jgi:hypothetical protein
MKPGNSGGKGYLKPVTEMRPAPDRLRLLIAAASWAIADAPGRTARWSVFILKASRCALLMVALASLFFACSSFP